MNVGTVARHIAPLTPGSGCSHLPFIDATSAAGCATAGGHYVWIQLNRPSGSASRHVTLRSTPAGFNSTVNYCEFSVSQCLPKIRSLARACISSAYTTPPNPPGWSSDVTRRTQIPMRSVKRQPKGCWFEFYLWSQIYLLRVLSAVWLTACKLAPLEMANARGTRLSPDVRPTGRTRPERPAGACRGKLSQPLRGGPRLWLTAICPRQATTSNLRRLSGHSLFRGTRHQLFRRGRNRHASSA
jgi:hypothetical protein